MPKPVLALFVLAAIFSVSAAGQSGRVQPTPAPAEAPIKVATQEIKLNVLAFDEDGKFVSDVAEKDLVITENNVLHQPSSVRRMPANVLIVMDTGGELRWMKSLEQTRKVANGLIGGLRPGDAVAIIQYSDKAEIVAEWTTDKNEALAAVARTNFGRRSAYVKSLSLAKDFFTKSSVDNKHLVLITDGTDSFADQGTKLRALRGLLSTDITVHVLSYTKMELTDIEPRTKMLSKSPPPKALPDEVVAGLPNGVRDAAQAPKIGPTINLDRKLLKTIRARKDDLEVSEEQLGELAANTNGEIIIPETKDEIIEKAAIVARMIDSSYVVTYTPKIPLEETGTEREIVVTSKRPGLVVEARRKLIVN
ncbi:MAG: VWA domain-containing protein, partial [Acidobacteria bacterium]|nr:VWA domain-containing protein [Acidobacteriota bacterium]